jgi:hypothetical protein
MKKSVQRGLRTASALISVILQLVTIYLVIHR